MTLDRTFYIQPRVTSVHSLYLTSFDYPLFLYLPFVKHLTALKTPIHTILLRRITFFSSNCLQKANFFDFTGKGILAINISSDYRFNFFLLLTLHIIQNTKLRAYVALY